LFGRLKQRWRCLHSQFESVDVEYLVNCVHAAFALHNALAVHSGLSTIGDHPGDYHETAALDPVEPSVPNPSNHASPTTREFHRKRDAQATHYHSALNAGLVRWPKKADEITGGDAPRELATCTPASRCAACLILAGV
jgi:hypothetical protein